MRAPYFRVGRFDGREYETRDIETVKDIIDYTTYTYPDSIMYMYKDVHKEPFKELTYGDFRERMDAMGTALIHMGLKNAKIAIIGNNSWRWALSYFTTVCGVGTIVPIDRNLKQEEIINLLNRAEVEMLFVAPRQFNDADVLFKEIPTLRYIALMQDQAYDDPDDRIMTQDEIIDKGRELLMQNDGSYMDANVRPEDLSTIIFTSGTTGLAKGVMLSHYNIASNVQNMSKYFHAAKHARALSILPMHHTYEMTCLTMTAIYQVKTVVFCEGLKYLQDNFVEAKCTVMLGVPLIFESIHKKIFRQAEKSGEAENLQKGLDFAKKHKLGELPKVSKTLFKSVHKAWGNRLECFIAGGAAIDPQVMIDFKAMGLPIIQGYGMTECAPIIALNPDTCSTDYAAGLPLPGTELRIGDPDEDGNGEILVKSPSVMIGYYNDPEATAAAIDEDGWLHTGDLGYLDNEGWLYITGRKKNVIVTKGGKNIYPEEIEYYLLLEEEISEAMVYGKDGLAGDDTVVTAIIVPNHKELNNKGFVGDEAIFGRLDEIVENVNLKVPAYKKIRRVEVRKEEFVKTTTLKIKRAEQANYQYDYDSKTYNKGHRY